MHKQLFSHNESHTYIIPIFEGGESGHLPPRPECNKVCMYMCVGRYIYSVAIAT